MKVEELRLKVGEALKGLEESGDIVITTATHSVVINKFVEALARDVKSILDDDEFGAVLNSLNVLAHDVKLDDRDFQTIIGIERDDLKVVLDKLRKTS